MIFAALYRLLRDEGGWHSSQEALWQALRRGTSASETAENQPVPFLTLLLMCDVLRERGLIDYRYPMGHITLCSVKGKVDLMGFTGVTPVGIEKRGGKKRAGL